MKIILSPSKTQNFDNTYNGPVTEPVFISEAEYLTKQLKRMSKEMLSKTMKIEGTLLEETSYNIKNFDILTHSPAIHTYTGLVYKYMNLSDYNDSMLSFMNEHLVILSALYGILKPMDGIKPYRLDMKMKIMNLSLYDYWKTSITKQLKGETIIDLASNEFSKMVPLPKVSIGFRQQQGDQYKNIATFSKMARGQLLDSIIKHQINEIEDLKALIFDGYTYNDSLSDEQTLFFTRPYKKKS